MRKLIGKAGQSVAKVVPLWSKVQRTGRGSLRGRIGIRDDFDEPLEVVAEVCPLRADGMGKEPYFPSLRFSEIPGAAMTEDEISRALNTGFGRE